MTPPPTSDTGIGAAGEGTPDLIARTTSLMVRMLVRAERVLHGLGLRAAHAFLERGKVSEGATGVTDGTTESIASDTGAAGAAPAETDGFTRWETLMAPRMRATLRYVYTHSEERGFFFNLLGHKTTSEKLADIRVRIAIAPSLERSSAPQQEARFTLVLPRFLEIGPDPAQFAIRLATGGRVEVETGVSQTSAVDAAVRAVRFGAARFEPAEPLPPEMSHSLIATFATWRRTRAEGERGPLRTDESDQLRRLFDKIAVEFAALLRHIEVPETYNAAHSVLPLADIFSENYRLTEVRARFLVNLGRDGRMVTDPDEKDRRQVDIEGTMTSFADPPNIDLNFWIPDFLVAGDDYHKGFLDALRSENGSEKLFKHLERARKRGGIKISRESFDRFLASPDVESSALFLRSAQKVSARAKERNIIALAGHCGGKPTRFYFEARFVVTPWPEVKVEDLEKLRLLWAWTEDDGWQKGDIRSDMAADPDPVSAYVKSAIGLLARWRGRMDSSQAA